MPEYISSSKIGQVKKVSNIYADDISPSWWRNIQEWNPTGEFDVPSNKAARVICTLGKVRPQQ